MPRASKPVPLGPVPFKLRLRQLRAERGLSQEDLAWETRKHGPGVSYNAIRKYESGLSRVGSKAKGERERSAEARGIYQQLAGALEVEPEEFHEYRLLTMRDALDEAVVGLEVALATLALIEGVTPNGVVPPLPAGLSQKPESTAPSGRGRKRSQSRQAS